MTPKQIRSLREKWQLSQEAFASLIGCQQHMVSHWENGKHKPTGAYLKRLKELAEVPVTEKDWTKLTRSLHDPIERESLKEIRKIVEKVQDSTVDSTLKERETGQLLRFLDGMYLLRGLLHWRLRIDQAAKKERGAKHGRNL